MNTLGKLLVSIFILTSLTACGKFKSSSIQSENQLPKFKLGALGDSITRGYDISQLFKEDIDKNWSTGRSLSGSILNQLMALISPEIFSAIATNNMAITGQTVSGSNSLFQAGAQQMAAFAPHIVTLEIGANDVCQGLADTPEKVALFQQKISAAISTLNSASTRPLLISVATVPNIWSLTQISQLSSNQGCQNAWAIACPNFSAGQTAFQAQWTAVNQALAAAASTAGSNVIFDNHAVANTTFTVNDTSSIDCFHPSELGQTKLANAVWSTISNNVNQILSGN